VLLHFADQHFVRAFRGFAGDTKSVKYRWDMASGKLYVHNGADYLND
jgi:hypothetical protein